jgi:hypothetical protein
MSLQASKCDEYSVPQEVRLTPLELVDDFVASLRAAGTAAWKEGRSVVVEDGAGMEPELRLELLFFLRTWALAHPELAFELVENGADMR